MMIGFLNLTFLKIFKLIKIQLSLQQQNFNKCIIDVGCYSNGTRGKFLKKTNNLPVIFIDANQDVLRALKVEDDDIKICAALSNRSGISKFNFYYYEETNSICEINLDNATEWIIEDRKSKMEEWTLKEVRMVPMLCLADIIESLNIKSIAALKIDAQGHDLQVVFGLKQYVSLVDYIELEVSVIEKELYKKSSKKNEVVEYLNKSGFVLLEEHYQSCNQEQNLHFAKKTL